MLRRVEMAGNRLYQTGYFPIAIEEKSASVSLDLSDLWKRFQKVKLEELIVFSQQLLHLIQGRIAFAYGVKESERTDIESKV